MSDSDFTPNNTSIPGLTHHRKLPKDKKICPKCQVFVVKGNKPVCEMCDGFGNK